MSVILSSAALFFFLAEGTHTYVRSSTAPDMEQSMANDLESMRTELYFTRMALLKALAEIDHLTDRRCARKEMCGGFA